MSLRDQPVALQQRDLAVLVALTEDRAECGPGLTRADIERIGATRWPHRVLRRLREAGYRIASIGTEEETERWQLLEVEPKAERAVDDARTLAAKDDQACAPRPVDGSLTDRRLFELPATPHYDVKAAA